ncbi:MAG: hypothetical protein V7754_08920 [Halioglobus sp.]
MSPPNQTLACTGPALRCLFLLAVTALIDSVRMSKKQGQATVKN